MAVLQTRGWTRRRCRTAACIHRDRRAGTAVSVTHGRQLSGLRVTLGLASVVTVAADGAAGLRGAVVEAPGAGAGPSLDAGTGPWSASGGGEPDCGDVGREEFWSATRVKPC